MPDAIENEKRIGSYAGLISIPLGTGTNDYLPNLDNLPDNITGYVDFDNYWSEIIFIDNEKNLHSRKDIVLSIANQDGGSHVDPSLNEKYYKLSRQNSLGWNTSNAEGEWVPAGKAELAAVRQITHELLRTLVLDYPRKEAIMKGDGIMIGGAGVILGFQSNQKICKVGRRAFCPCGSGKKYKNCCEKK